MTPEMAYAMRAPIDARIRAIEAERAALEELELAYDNYLRAVGAPLEQPEQGQAVPPGSPAPVEPPNEADEGARAPEGEAAGAWAAAAASPHRKALA